MKSLKQLMTEKDQYDPVTHKAAAGAKNKFVTREYQDYGYRLAMELGDEKHKSLYIKLAKVTERAILEKCRTFVMDSKADNKGALFMWKLKECRSRRKPTDG